MYIGVPSANEENVSIYNSNKAFATWIVKELCCDGRYTGDRGQISMGMSNFQLEILFDGLILDVKSNSNLPVRKEWESKEVKIPIWRLPRLNFKLRLTLKVYAGWVNYNHRNVKLLPTYESYLMQYNI